MAAGVTGEDQHGDFWRPSSDEINGYLQRRKKGPGKEKEGRTKDKM